MDVRTGEVRRLQDFVDKMGIREVDALKRAGRLVEVSEDQMTDDQARRMESDEQPVVMPGDRRSDLFRIKNSARNQPCRCSSGVKYKKCCLFKDRIELNRGAQ